MTDIIVIGGGHAGCEAALACARMGMETVLLTLNIESIALMPCNPSIGGTGKGHLVREVDALGGEMGLAADDVTLQSRMLNTSKGPAVHSLRCQADKRAYQSRMLSALFSQEHLTIRQGECAEILVHAGKVTGVRNVDGEILPCRAAVLCTGVYLKSRIIIGETSWEGGPQGLLGANRLSENLRDLGFEVRRFKTGTPARIDGRSIDFSRMDEQVGDEPITPFSFLTDRKLKNTKKCYLTWTNSETHRIIQENLHRAPMFTGAITGVGARYCPSIETKIVRFADKDRHQIFIEPEGQDHPEWYAQGLSTSMPQDVQWKMYRSIKGLENCVLTRLAYAIEYDCINPTALSASLGALEVEGLFFAGQINGTSGYEEAAAQGILAGINASQYVREREMVVLSRDEAYIGVLCDDLTTKGTDEPYRMMTSRAEFRLLLRQDNADLRLTALSHSLGLAGDERMFRAERKAREAAEIIHILESEGRIRELKKPEARLDMEGFSPDSVREAEITIKYEGYLDKEKAQVAKMRAMENRLLRRDTPYLEMSALRLEARQKLAAQKPRSLGQASRIPGVSPADISVLMVWLMRNEHAETMEGKR